MLANGSRGRRAVNTRGSKTNMQQPMADQVEDYLQDAERKWVLAKRVWADFRAETNPAEKEKKKISAEKLEDMSNLAMKKYSKAKSSLRQWRGIDVYIIPVDNMMHSMWNGIDITMNGELVSTTNQKGYV